MVLADHESFWEEHTFTKDGRVGKLYIVPSWINLLERCGKHNGFLKIDLPKTGEGLSSRVRSNSKTFRHIEFMSTDSTDFLEAKEQLPAHWVFRPLTVGDRR